MGADLMSIKSQPAHTRRSEAGGITIILSLILLSIMTVAAISVNRTSLRELAITGNESTGRKASESADSGLDWVITWSNPDAANSILVSTDPTTGANTSSVVSSTLTGAEGIVQAQMVKLLDAIGNTDLRTTGDDPTPNSPAGTGPGSYGLLSNNNGSLRFFIRSGDYTSATAPHLFQTGYVDGSNGFTQKSVVAQAFDVEVRYLGVSLGNKASGTRAKKQGSLFLIRSVGRANITGTGQSFIAQREVLVDYTP